jgi:hypothetical protein
VLAILDEIQTFPALTCDGRMLYFVRGTQSGDLWVARFDGDQTPATPYFAPANLLHCQTS